MHSVIPALVTAMHISWSITCTAHLRLQSNIPQLHWHEYCWFRPLRGRLKVIGAAEWAPLGPVLRDWRRLKERTHQQCPLMYSHVCERCARDDTLQVSRCVSSVDTCKRGRLHVIVWCAEELSCCSGLQSRAEELPKSGGTKNIAGKCWLVATTCAHRFTIKVGRLKNA